MNQSESALLDRWKVRITPTDESANSKTSEKFVLNNYFR